ncbi:hypothetical protein [Paucibacter sp. XJ19-41]|uniref:hypothetical protein n=1 Tax=Paucibacter sp. XJ19-41 TaxID=2927824 RepID=UPI00234AA2FB|nr:hypothetical protein [Paucibacter sp. XJ19-41]MDC6170677.1 hypothetical protein [Paucibacter sp. XJ19-41]
MFCSRSITIHLLRGAAAALLLVLALWPGPLAGWLRAIALAGAVVLMRGCPMCWLLGLFETLRRRFRT